MNSNNDEKNSNEFSTQPVIAIGGVGGSGTRIIASTVRALDFDCGNYLNGAIDNLCFTFLLKNTEVFRRSDELFAPHFKLFLKSLEGGHRLNPNEWDILNRQLERLINGKETRRAFAETRLHGVVEAIQRPATSKAKFWKEPNTHIFLPQLLASGAELKYIHVIRNGLDMVLSKNLGQFRLWGSCLFDLPREPTNNGILRYWAKSNLRSLEALEASNANYLLIRFEEFCQNPKSGIREIADFVNKDISPKQLDELASYVNSPSSIGRHLDQDLGPIDEDNLAAMKSLGYGH